MNTVKIELELPEELAKRAESVGLLTNEEVALWLEEKLDTKRRKEEAIQYLKEMVIYSIWVSIITFQFIG